MLLEYKEYLLRIKESFENNGVFLEDGYILDYEDIFYLGERLSELLWFYSVLEIGNSGNRMGNFLFPLNPYSSNKTNTDRGIDSIEDDEFEVHGDSGIKEPIVHSFNPVNFISRVSEEDSLGDDFIDYGEDAEEVDLEDDEFINHSSSDEEIDLEDDEFIDYGEDTLGESEDDFNSWGTDDDEFVSYSSEPEDDDYEEDDFGTWGSPDNEDTQYLIDEDEEDYEDYFPEWSSDEEDYEIVDTEESHIQERGISEDEEDVFATWGSSEEEDYSNEVEYVDESEDEEDHFSSWGSDEDDDFSSELEESEEDLFTPWGGNDEEGFSNEIEDDEEDLFTSWGSSDDDDTFQDNEEEVEDEDVFSSWGSEEDDDSEYFEDEEEDSFGSWGNSEEKDTFSDSMDGNDVSDWGTGASTLNTMTNSSIADPKYDSEVKSNEKTAEIIKKVADGIFSGGILLKSKLSEKFKSMDNSQD